MIAIKVWLLLSNSVPFNADEAIVGLMARHIIQGERPVFFYGQAYMSSLDALLVAGGFMLFGENVWVIRLVQILLYSATIISTVLIGKVAFQSVETGLIAALLMAVPNINTTLYTTISLGGYGEALLLGNVILLIGLLMAQKTSWFIRSEVESSSNLKKSFSDRGWMLTFLLGASIGFGVWVNGLTLVYSIPVFGLVMYYLFRNWDKIGGIGILKHVFFGIVGLILGAAPWWIYAMQNGWQQLIVELFGNAVSVETTGYLQRLLSHLFNLVVLGGTVILGIRPPWEVRWLAMPLLPFNLIFWSGVIIFWIKQSWKRQLPYLLFGGIALVMAVGFVFTSFGVDPSGRYFLPLVVPMALIAGEMIQIIANRLPGKDIVWKAVCIGVVIIYNFWGTWECVLRNPPGVTSQFDISTVADRHYDEELILFLKENDCTYGYTNYWVAYPLNFLTSEELIYSPRLPYHSDLRYTPRDDRYTEYTSRIAEADTVTYITVKTPLLDEALETAFRKSKITWKDTWIGDYHVYYHLSEVIHPEEIDLVKPIE